MYYILFFLLNHLLYINLKLLNLYLSNNLKITNDFVKTPKLLLSIFLTIIVFSYAIVAFYPFKLNESVYGSELLPDFISIIYS